MHTFFGRLAVVLTSALCVGFLSLPILALLLRVPEGWDWAEGQRPGRQTPRQS